MVTDLRLSVVYLERVRNTFTFCFRTPGQNAATRHAGWYRAQFLREISRVLKGSGILRLVTDDPNYLQAIETHAADLLSLRQAEENGREYPPTEFQMKFLADSRPFYSLLLRRFS